MRVASAVAVSPVSPRSEEERGWVVRRGSTSKGGRDVRSECRAPRGSLWRCRRGSKAGGPASRPRNHPKGGGTRLQTNKSSNRRGDPPPDQEIIQKAGGPASRPRNHPEGGGTRLQTNKSSTRRGDPPPDKEIIHKAGGPASRPTNHPKGGGTRLQTNKSSRRRAEPPAPSAEPPRQ